MLTLLGWLWGLCESLADWLDELGAEEDACDGLIDWLGRLDWLVGLDWLGGLDADDVPWDGLAEGVP